MLHGMRYRYIELPLTLGLFLDAELDAELAHEVRAAGQRRRGMVDGDDGEEAFRELTLRGACDSPPRSRARHSGRSPRRAAPR